MAKLCGWCGKWSGRLAVEPDKIPDPLLRMQELCVSCLKDFFHIEVEEVEVNDRAC